MKKYLLDLILSSRKRFFLVKKNKIFKSLKNKPNYKLINFGNKNNKKLFYVIKRFGGGGFFSNLLFVLNHLIISEKFNAIPVVDMENFSNFYTENKKVNNTKNVWEYFFSPVSNYNLKEIYQSKNVLISDDLFHKNMEKNYIRNKSLLLKFFKKYIKIKKKYLLEASKFANKNFRNKKVLAVHWRGTDHKVLPNHPMPPTKDQIFTMVDKLIKNKKFNKIFLITEEKNNFDLFLSKYKNLVCFYKSFRTNNRKEFDDYSRKNHKFNLAKESLIEVLILSKLNTLVCSKSNISEVAVLISNKKFKIHEIDNGFNSNNLFISLFKWHVKKKLPYFLGGFKNNLL